MLAQEFQGSSNVILHRINRKELSELADWLKKEGNDINSWIWWKKYWKELDSSSEIPELSGMGLLDKIHHQINLKMRVDGDFSGKNKERTLLRLGKYLSRAAAILFIPLLLVSLIYFSQDRQKPAVQAITDQKSVYQKITSPVGNKTRLELADGSIVWLNHGSSLRFPLQFTGQKRTVYLEGEAYFEVKSNPASPFIVKASDLQFMATGTEFNIMAYPDEDVVEATLQSGRISLLKELPDNSDKNLLNLAPGQQAKYYPGESRIDHIDVDPDNYTSWKDGKLVMMNDPMSRIARKLERWFNVDIDFSSEELGYVRYSGTFTNETLAQVLDLMKLATPIDYTVYPRVKNQDGTYAVPRILIGVKKGYKLSKKPENPLSVK